MNPAGDLRRNVAEALAKEFVKPGSENMELRDAIAASRDLGDEMIDRLLDVMGPSSGERRSGLVSILDVVASGPSASPAARNRAAEKLLELIREGDRALRVSILEARTWLDASVSEETRGAFGAELISSLHAYRAPRFQDLTKVALLHLGRAAVGPLRASIRESPHVVERDAAASLLAEIAAKHSESAEAHAEQVEFLRTLEGGQRLSAGVAVRSVARACLSSHADAKLVAGIHDAYLRRLGRSSAAFDLLAALADLAASPACDPGVAADTALQIVEFLGRPLPDPQMTESKTEDGTLLTVGGQASVHTDLVPDLLHGLLRIGGTGRLPKRIVETVLDRLLEQFRSITEYREIWAPGNVILLAETIESMVRESGMDLAPRLRALEAMLTACTNLSIAGATSRLLDLQDEESPAYLALVAKYVARMLSLLAGPAYQEVQDQQAILEALGRAAGNVRVASDAEESAALKERIIELMVEQKVFDLRGGRELPDLLLASKHLSQRLRKKLEAWKGRRTR
jgi:hypothetical protein